MKPIIFLQMYNYFFNKSPKKTAKEHKISFSIRRICGGIVIKR
jgi:hypothetical protein